MVDTSTVSKSETGTGWIDSQKEMAVKEWALKALSAVGKSSHISSNHYFCFIKLKLTSLFHFFLNCQ